MTKVETIKTQIENGTYDWESAINDTAEKIIDRKFISFEPTKEYADLVSKRLSEGN